jgi:hypothetical protein
LSLPSLRVAPGTVHAANLSRGAGPYLKAHNKLSLGLDRILPAIAAVEASTLELVCPAPRRLATSSRILR